MPRFKVQLEVQVGAERCFLSQARQIERKLIRADELGQPRCGFVFESIFKSGNLKELVFRNSVPGDTEKDLETRSASTSTRMSGARA